MTKYETSPHTAKQLQAMNEGDLAITFGFTKEEAQLPLANGWHTIFLWPNGMACQARRVKGGILVCSFDGVRKVYKNEEEDDPVRVCDDFADRWRDRYYEKKRRRF